MRFEALNDFGWQACFSFWVEGFRVLMEFPIPEALQSVKDLKNTAMGGIMGLHQSNPDEGFMRAAMATSVTEICTLWMCFCHGACIGHFFFHSWVTGAVMSRWENAIKPQKLWELSADSGIPEVLSAHHLSSHWRDAPPWATWLVCFIQHLSKHEWFQQVALRCGHASGICPCPQQVPEPSVGLLAKWVCLSKIQVLKHWVKGHRCFFFSPFFHWRTDQDFQQERSGLGFQCCESFSRKPWRFLSLRSHLFHDKNWCYWRWINFGVPPPCSRWVVPMTTCSTDTKRHSARTISTSQISNVLSHSWSCRMQKCF